MATDIKSARMMMRTLASLGLDRLTELAAMFSTQRNLAVFARQIAQRIHDESEPFDNPGALDARPVERRDQPAREADSRLTELTFVIADPYLRQAVARVQLPAETIDRLLADRTTGLTAYATLARNQLTLTGSQIRTLAQRDHTPTNTALLQRSDTPHKVRIELLQGRRLNPRARKQSHVEVDLPSGMIDRGMIHAHDLVEAAATSSSPPVIELAIQTIVDRPQLFDGARTSAVKLMFRLLEVIDEDLPGLTDTLSGSICIPRAAKTLRDAFDEHGELDAFVQALDWFVPARNSAVTVPYADAEVSMLLTLLTGIDPDSRSGSNDQDGLTREEQLARIFPHGQVELWGTAYNTLPLVSAAAILGTLDTSLPDELPDQTFLERALLWPHLIDNGTWNAIIDEGLLSELSHLPVELMRVFQRHGMRTTLPPLAAHRGNRGTLTRDELDVVAAVLEPARAFFALAGRTSPQTAAAMLEERLGDDPGGWQTMLSLIGEFDGTFAELLECCDGLGAAA